MVLEPEIESGKDMKYEVELIQDNTFCTNIYQKQLLKPSYKVFWKNYIESKST